MPFGKFLTNDVLYNEFEEFMLERYPVLNKKGRGKRLLNVALLVALKPVAKIRTSLALLAFACAGCFININCNLKYRLRFLRLAADLSNEPRRYHTSNDKNLYRRLECGLNAFACQRA